jgi:hypothetical protein
MIVLGKSIGSLFAIEFASTYKNVNGLIIQSGFSNVEDFIVKRWKQKNKPENGNVTVK